MFDKKPMNIVAKVRKSTLGVVINKGDRIKAELGKDGDATYMLNRNIKLKPEEYELIIPEEAYDALLQECK